MSMSTSYCFSKKHPHNSGFSKPSSINFHIISGFLAPARCLWDRLLRHSFCKRKKCPV